MDQMTQQNAALVEQTAAASHAMGDQARELQNLMGFFKLDGQEPITKATVAASAVDAAHPKVASKAPAGSRRGRGASEHPTIAAVKPVVAKARPLTEKKSAAATSAAEEWEEF